MLKIHFYENNITSYFMPFLCHFGQFPPEVTKNRYSMNDHFRVKPENSL